MSDLIKTVECPCCKSKKNTGLVVDDECVEVWECFDCDKIFELKKTIK